MFKFVIYINEVYLFISITVSALIINWDYYRKRNWFL